MNRRREPPNQGSVKRGRGVENPAMTILLFETCVLTVVTIAIFAIAWTICDLSY